MWRISANWTTPPTGIEVVVTSDASTDRTEELAEAAGARVIRNPRGGKVAAQDSAVRQTESDIVAFSDANCTWAPNALRKLVRSFADPEVAYVCGRLNLESGDGGNKEGLYWRFELALRADESRIDSVTGGNGSIYAVRREDYLEVDPRFGHDLSFPYRMVQRGKRAVYEPEANAYEKTTPTNEDEYRRKVRMFEHCWAIVVEGKMLRRLRPLYFVEVVSHRHLRYASGLLHVVLLGSTVALLGDGPLYQIALGLQLGLLAAAALGVGVARYYVLVSWATLEALVKYLRRGVPDDVGSGGGDALNRAADVAVAGTALVVASPLLGLAALATKLGDRGPVLYRQTRVGKDGADFELLKLRTMIVGAEKVGAGYAVNEGDPRITRVGRVLRKLSLDELPQLWNVVRGEMSVIGPRPDAPLPGGEVHGAPAAAARREAGDHRLGAGARPRGAAVGRADRARRLVRRPPLRPARPEDPREDAARALRRHVQGRRRWLESSVLSGSRSGSRFSRA